MGWYSPTIPQFPADAARANQRGFTLIEIVVVLFIMATMAGIALLALGDAGRGDKLKAEATRLHDAMALASEEAQMRGAAIGTNIESSDYRFSVWHVDHWQALEQDPILRAHRLPEGMHLTLDRPAPAPDKPGDAGRPDLIFYSSGESTAFQLGLAERDGTGSYQVTGNGYGTFSITSGSRPQ